MKEEDKKEVAALWKWSEYIRNLIREENWDKLWVALRSYDVLNDKPKYFYELRFILMFQELGIKYE